MATILYLIKKKMLLSSLEGLSRPTVNNKEHKEQRRKNKKNFPVCDCVHLLCSPECQVLEENKVSRSSLPPYSLSDSLSSQHFAGTCRIQVLQHQETPEMKHKILDALHGLYKKLLLKICIFCNQPTIQKLTDCSILDWREWLCVFVITCELPRRDSELQKCYRMWSYIWKMLFNILTASCLSRTSFELLRT